MEERAWAIFWAVVVICITILSTMAVLEHTKRTIKFIEGGYSRQSLPGMAEAEWVRP